MAAEYALLRSWGDTYEFVIPRHAHETSRGWSWREDFDPGDPGVGPQPDVVRFVLARRRAYRVMRDTHRGTTTVILPVCMRERGFDNKRD